MSPSKHKKNDRMTVVNFAVNFCAIFALILLTGALVVAEAVGGRGYQMASFSQSLQNNACSCTEAAQTCAPVVPAVLFPVSSSEPVEVPAEIAIDDAGFSPKELNMALSSSRMVKVSNKGVNPHSFVIDSIGVDSGAIAPGQSKTVVLENLPQDGTALEFYSNVAGDSAEKFSGTVIVN